MHNDEIPYKNLFSMYMKMYVKAVHTLCAVQGMSLEHNYSCPAKKKTKSAMFFFVFGSQNVKQTERVEVASQTERGEGFREYQQGPY